MDSKFNTKKFIVYTLILAIIGAIIIDVFNLTGILKYTVIGGVAITANIMARK